MIDEGILAYLQRLSNLFVETEVTDRQGNALPSKRAQGRP